MHHYTAFDLRIPRNMTALMQHLQHLVSADYTHYVAGHCSVAKLSSFVSKVEARYPITRSPGGRCYDRSRGRAGVQFVIYPDLHFKHPLRSNSGVLSLGNARIRNTKIVEALHFHPEERNVAWWLLSTEGKGGLADPDTANAREACDAMRSQEHIVYRDYVLVYAHKLERSSTLDVCTGGPRPSLKTTSTWTWRMRTEVIKELYAQVDECCNDLAFGAEPTAVRSGHGLLGLLHAQRMRPLFAGVRSQIFQLERYARDEWARRASLWRATHPNIVDKLGSAAGELRSMRELLTTCMPKMIKQAVYDNPPLRIRDMIR